MQFWIGNNLAKMYAQFIISLKKFSFERFSIVKVACSQLAITKHYICDVWWLTFWNWSFNMVAYSFSKTNWSKSERERDKEKWSNEHRRIEVKKYVRFIIHSIYDRFDNNFEIQFVIICLPRRTMSPSCCIKQSTDNSSRQ